MYKPVYYISVFLLNSSSAVALSERPGNPSRPHSRNHNPLSILLCLLLSSYSFSYSINLFDGFL